MQILPHRQKHQRLLHHIPAIRKGQSNSRSDDCLGHRQRNVEVAANRPCSINLRCLKQFAGNADHALSEQEHIERRRQRRKDDRPHGIHQADGTKGQHGRNHRDLERQQKQHDHSKGDHIASPEAEPGQCIGQHGNHHSLSQQNRHGVHDGVEIVAQDAGVLDQHTPVLIQREHLRRQLDLHQLLSVLISCSHELLDFCGRTEGIDQRQHQRQQKQDGQQAEDAPEEYVSFSHISSLLRCPTLQDEQNSKQGKHDHSKGIGSSRYHLIIQTGEHVVHVVLQGID